MVLLMLSLCIVFYIAIVLYIAIVGDLAPQVVLLSSMKDDTFSTYSLPLKVETR
jgi:hypothetical protein